MSNSGLLFVSCSTFFLLVMQPDLVCSDVEGWSLVLRGVI